MVNKSHQMRLQILQDRGLQLIAPHMPLQKIYHKHKILTLKALTQLPNIKLCYKDHHNELATQLMQNMRKDHRKE